MARAAAGRSVERDEEVSGMSLHQQWPASARLAQVVALLAALGAVLIAALAGASAARGESMRYTLTATSSNEQDRYWYSASQWLGPDATVFSSINSEDEHLSWTWTAASVRPFAITRDGDRFTFTAPVAGRFSALTSRTSWWWFAPDPYSCWWYWAGSAMGPVSGTVALGELNPAQLTVRVGAYEPGETPPQVGTLDRVWCSGSDRQPWVPSEAIARLRALLKRYDLRKKYGKAFTLTDSRVVKGDPSYVVDQTASRWTFRFTPVVEPAKEEEQQKPKQERWQIEVRGRDRSSWGMFTGLRGGVWVDWAQRTTLGLEDGKLTSALASAHVLGVTPFSEPPGGFTVTGNAQPTPPFEPTVTKTGDSVRILLGNRGNPPAYRLDFTLQVAGPVLLDRLRQIGVANPEQTYQSLLARGPITDREVVDIPNNKAVVAPLRPGTFSRESGGFADQLPCPKVTQQDCFLNRGGEIVTVTRLK